MLVHQLYSFIYSSTVLKRWSQTVIYAIYTFLQLHSNTIQFLVLRFCICELYTSTVLLFYSDTDIITAYVCIRIHSSKMFYNVLYINLQSCCHQVWSHKVSALWVCAHRRAPWNSNSLRPPKRRQTLVEAFRATLQRLGRSLGSPAPCKLRASLGVEAPCKFRDLKRSRWEGQTLTVGSSSFRRVNKRSAKGLPCTNLPASICRIGAFRAQSWGFFSNFAGEPPCYSPGSGLQSCTPFAWDST